MSLHPYTASPEQIQTMFAEGRGKGTGANYLPFLTLSDVRQRKGEMRRLTCALSGRHVTLFSQLARSVRLALEQSGRYLTIDEYVPLDPQLVRAAAAKLGITPPREDMGKTSVLMATFRAMSSGEKGPKVEPFIVCSCSQLKNFSAAVELEIQRRAWAELGATMKVITDATSCMPVALCNNLEILFPHRLAPAAEPSPGYHERLDQQVCQAVLEARSEQTLQEFVQELDTRLSVQAGDCINAAFRLIWRRRLNAALAGPLLHEQLVADIGRRSQP